MRPTEPPRPLIPSMARELPQRGNRRVLLWLGMGGGGLVGLLILWTSKGKQPIVRDLVPDRPPPEQTVRPTTSPDALRYPLTYVQEPPATPVPAQSPVPPPAQQVQAPPPQTPPGRPPSSSVQPPPRPGVIQAPQVIIQQPPPPAPAQAAPGARAIEPPAPPPHRGFRSGQAQPTPTLEPPLKDDPQAAGQPSKLFQPAAWERPKDPYKVLYWHQRVQGQLAQDLRSDIPGVFLIKTTEPVMDPWGHGHTIIPLDTYW